MSSPARVQRVAAAGGERTWTVLDGEQSTSVRVSRPRPAQPPTLTPEQVGLILVVDGRAT